MKIIIAPDSFKESLTADQVCDAIEIGILKIFPDASTVKIPLSDGGEGLTSVLTKATHGTFISKEVTGPLGQPVQSVWGLSGDRKTAIIEIAVAAGLDLIPVNKRNPFITTTYGVGELIGDALKHEVQRIILGLGGSCTHDAGVGAMKALGVKFYDKSGKEIVEGTKGLLELHSIELNNLNQKVAETEFIIACDVDNPLYGPNGAAYTYAIQKGASPQDLPIYDQAMINYSEILKRDLNIDVRNIQGGGAAGGIGVSIYALLNGKFRKGIDLVFLTIGFEDCLKNENIDMIITGEGQVNEQSIHGKVISGVIAKAAQHGIPVIIITGGKGSGAEKIIEMGATAIESIVNRPMTINEAIRNASELVVEKAVTIGSLIKLGTLIKKNN